LLDPSVLPCVNDDRFTNESEIMADKKSSGCLGNLIVLVLLAVIGIAWLGRRSGDQPRTEPPPPSRPKELPNDGRAELVSAEIRPWMNPEGKEFQKVYVTWKNVGDVPIRTVKAVLRLYDADGNFLVDQPANLLYSVSMDDPGIAVGETHVAPEGRGEPLPVMLDVGRVEVDITKASSKSRW